MTAMVATQQAVKPSCLDQTLAADQYLCQVSTTVSCGACCGLYNVADPSPTALENLLRRRTKMFATTARTVRDIDSFAAWVTATENQLRPLADFHHCPFLGLIGPERQTVGCLLHPAGNQGTDWRGLSYYGGLACRVYFCPSTRLLPDRYKQLIKAIAPDWHWYGLVVTEHRLVNAMLLPLENQLGGIRVDNLAADENIRQALVSLLGLKINWPFRPPRFRTCCHNMFAANHPGRPPLQGSLVAGLDPELKAVLEAMGSWFESAAQVEKACQLINSRYKAVIAAVKSRNPQAEYTPCR